MLSNILVSRMTSYADEITGITSENFGVINKLLVRYFAFVIYWRKWEYNGTVHRLFIDFEKANDSVRRETVCNIFTEFGITMKLVRLIKLCLNETCSQVRTGKNLCDAFPIQNVMKQDVVFRYCF
jgi:hypothetical protein